MKRSTFYGAAAASLFAFAFAVPAQAIEITPNLAGVPGGWVVDRYAPNTFLNAGTLFGRDNVLEVSTTIAQASVNRGAQSASFYNTQGRKTSVTGGLGDRFSADIYVPSSWGSRANGSVRTDMWLSVDNIPAGSDPHSYAIMGFTMFFFAGLVILTLCSMHNFPLHTVTH